MRVEIKNRFIWNELIIYIEIKKRFILFERYYLN